MKLFSNKLIDSYASILIGIVIFCILLNPQILFPANTNWIGSGDPVSAYLGWVFFRNDAWTLPLGLIPSYGVGLNASLVYTDSIPILAIFLKLFNGWLPDRTQFFGAWYLLVMLGQSILGWKFSQLITTDFVCKALITLLYSISPALLGMISLGWSSESAHFLILSALYLCLIPNRPSHFYWWCALLIISVAVCFYIFLIVGVLWISTLIHELSNGLTSIRKLFLRVTTALILVIGIAWLVGYFTMMVGVAQSGIQTIGEYGYGKPTYSFDILSPFYDPGWSYLLKGLPTSVAPNKGFNYLGLGMILGLGFFLLSAKATPYQFIRNRFAETPFLYLGLGALLILGVTNTIRIGPAVFTIQIPDYFYSILSIIRASNRLVWPIYYLFFYFIFLQICNQYSQKNARKILTIIFVVQFLDTSAGWLPMRLSSGNKDAPPYSEALKDPLWSNSSIFANYNTIFRIPLEGNKVSMATDLPESWEIFGYYAGYHKMGLNAVALARENKEQIKSLNDKLDQSIESGLYDPHSIYIIDNEHVAPVLRHLDRARDEFVQLDGFNVLLPGWNVCQLCPKVDSSKQIKLDIAPEPSIGSLIGFGKGKIGSRYLIGLGQAEQVGWGWSFPEEWGVWAEGTRAILVLPYPKGAHPHKIILEIQAFLNSKVTYQIVNLLVNNELQKKIVIKNPRETVEVDLPINPFKDYVVIEFQLPSAASPLGLGLGEDKRRLSVGLVSAKLE